MARHVTLSTIYEPLRSSELFLALLLIFQTFHDFLPFLKQVAQKSCEPDHDYYCCIQI